MLTLNFHTRTEGSRAYRAPAAMPASHAIMATKTGGPGRNRAVTVATSVPVTIWPSTPRLMYPARQLMPVAMAQMMMGVARVRVEKR